MPGSDRKIDPETLDYVQDGAGGTESTQTAQTALHHAINGRRGEWWGDALHGSRLGAILDRGRSTTVRTPIELRDALKQVLDELVAEGYLRDYEVITDRDGQLGKWQVTAFDGASGEPLDLTSLLPSLI